MAEKTGSAKRFVELNHLIENDMQPYPGLSGPKIGARLDHEASRPKYQHQAEFYLGHIEMDCNTGTYLDSPFHRYPGATDIARVPLERVASLSGVVLTAEVPASRALDLQAPESSLQGKAVLVQTSWDTRWNTPDYYKPGPYLSPATIELLLRARPALVGVDFWNVDDTGDPARPAHTRLLGAGILIVEHLCNLRSLPREGFRFYAVPLRVAGGASFPVRAFAELDGE